MKNKLVLISVMFLANTLLSLAQDESKYELKSADDVTLIKSPKFDVSIFEVYENKYYQIGTSSGPKHVEILGYRLSEGLKVLGNYTGQPVRIGNLQNNPFIKWRIDTFNPMDLPKIKEDIFSELAKYYDFKILKENAQIRNYELTIKSKAQLETYKVKKIKKGVMGESNQKKSGGWIISHSTIENLTRWVEKTHNIKFKNKNFTGFGFYDFDFNSDSLDGIISELAKKYGIDLIFELNQEDMYIIQ